MLYIIRPYASLPSDGASNDRYVSLCLQLKARGLNVLLLCSNFIHNRKVKRSHEQMRSNKNALPFVVELDSFRYAKNTSLSRVLHELFFGAKALSFAIRNKPQSIIIGEPLFFVGWLFILYGLVFRTKINADVIDIWPEADTRSSNGLKGIAFRTLSSILKASRSVRFRFYSKITFVSASYSSMFRHSNNKKHAVFYWGSNLLPQRTVTRVRDRVTIVYAGSFGEGYDIVTILDAAKLLASQKDSHFSFVIAGGGQQESLVRETARNGYIEYVGYVDKEELIDIYMKADIGLLPYKSKSMVAMPIKFFDYINFGIFIISSLSLEAADIIRSNHIGSLYRPGDSHDLCEKILEASKDPLKFTRAALSCEQLSEYYSIKRQYADFADFITDDI